MRHLKNQRNILLMAVLIFGVFSFLGSAGAMNWNLGDEAKLFCDVAVTYGLSTRVSDQDDEKLADANADDGNRNFDQWDLTNNKVTVLADIELSYKDFGLFVRPKAFYDHVYMSDNSNDSPSTNNAYVAGIIDRSDQWADKVEETQGVNAELLDYFAYGSFRLGPVPMDLRVGSQVISWGESAFIPGLSAAQSTMDISAATAVGTETKEIWLPTGAVYLQTGLGDVGLRGYYQYEWKKSQLYEGGTFYSTSDMLDEIHAPLVIGTLQIPRGQDEEAKNGGEYGVALSYMLPWAATEISGYYLNYHEKSPSIIRTTIPTEYHVYYPEDQKLYGFSFASVLGDVQIGGEVSWRDDLVIGASRVGPEEIGAFLQAQFSFTWLYTPPAVLADRIIFTGETAYGALKEVGDKEEGFKYVGAIMIDWYQVFRRTDLGLNFKFQDSPVGNAKLAAMDFTEDKSSYAVTVDCIFNDVWKGEITYEDRFQDHSLSDRDTLSMKLSYYF